MYDKCSVDSYERLRQSGDLATSQAMYLSAFIESKSPMTHIEATNSVYKLFGRAMPARNGRLRELEEKGLVEKVDTVFCTATGRVVNRWKWTGRYRAFEASTEWVACEHCYGKGGHLKKVYRQTEPQKDLFI